MANKTPFFQTDKGVFIKVSIIIMALSFIYIIYEKNFTVTIFDFLYSTLLCISFSLALGNFTYNKETIKSSLQMGMTRKNIWKNFINKLLYAYIIIVACYLYFTIMHFLVYKSLSFITLILILSFVFMSTFYFLINLMSFYLGQMGVSSKIIMLIYIILLISCFIRVVIFQAIMSIILIIMVVIFYYLNQKKLFKKTSIKE